MSYNHDTMTVTMTKVWDCLRRQFGWAMLTNIQNQAGVSNGSADVYLEFFAKIGIASKEIRKANRGNARWFLALSNAPLGETAFSEYSSLTQAEVYALAGRVLPAGKMPVYKPGRWYNKKYNPSFFSKDFDLWA